VLLVGNYRRLFEAAGYPPDQQTGYKAGRHVPKENIQRNLLSGRSRIDDSTKGLTEATRQKNR
jgi:hypothetical protein